LINSLRQAVYKHGYLIITAAWLYTISFIFSNYWSYHSSPLKVKNNLEQRLQAQEKEFAGIISDTAQLLALIDQTSVSSDRLKDDIGLFIYQQKVNETTHLLRYWNTNRMYINTEDMLRNEGSYFVGNQNGDFEMIKKMVNIKGEEYSVIAMLPVRWSYFIENKYLHTDFAGYNGLNKQYEISADPVALPIINSAGQELFRIKLKEGKSFISYDSTTVILRVLAIILLLIFFHSLAQELIIQRSFRTGYLFLLAAVIVLRVIAYRFSFPFDFSKLPLFDPSVYASNFLHPSLGDLFVNAVLLFWLVSFYKTYNDHRPWFKYSIPANAYSYTSLFALTVICFLLVGVISSLVQDSKISFDVTNLMSLTVYSVISFILLCFLVLSFFHFSQILLKPAIRYKINRYGQILAIVLFGFLYLLLFTSGANTRIYLLVLLWLVLYVLLLNIRKSDIDKPLLKSSFFIFWVMIFAMSVASVVIYQNRLVEFEQRKRIAEKLALQTDPSGERISGISC